jgi:hypothetical protein
VTSKDAVADCGCCDAVAAVLLLVAELVLVAPPHPAVNHTARAATRKVGRPRLIRLSSSLSGPGAQLLSTGRQGLPTPHELTH